MTDELNAAELRAEKTEAIPPSELASWSELAARATPGPWVQWVKHGRVFRGPLKENNSAWISGGGREVARCETDAEGEEDPCAIQDAAFIAASREALPRLVAAYSQSQAEVERLTHELSACREILRNERQQLRESGLR